MTINIQSISKIIFMYPNSNAQVIPNMDAPNFSWFFVQLPIGEVKSSIRLHAWSLNIPPAPILPVLFNALPSMLILIYRSRGHVQVIFDTFVAYIHLSSSYMIPNQVGVLLTWGKRKLLVYSYHHISHTWLWCNYPF